MKLQYSACPPFMQNMPTYGFSWMEFVCSIPSPMFVITTYKPGGIPNACMQSWTTFTGNENGFYAIVSSVNKNGHLYKTLKETGDAVINFMSADHYDACMATIKNNAWEKDEITSSGLTAVPAAVVNAPMIDECFMNLECRLLWEKEIVPGDDHVIACLEVVNVHIDPRHADESDLGRLGKTGILYNVHHPVNPEGPSAKSRDAAAVLTRIIESDEY